MLLLHSTICALAGGRISHMGRRLARADVYANEIRLNLADRVPLATCAMQVHVTEVPASVTGRIERYQAEELTLACYSWYTLHGRPV